MLWYKAWLETRWRFGYVAGFILGTLGIFQLVGISKQIGPGLRLESTLMFCFAALYLAGSGINTQTFYSARSSFHGSMLFTLSLPVSRLRLFMVRAALGAFETCFCVCLMGALTLVWLSGPVSTGQFFQYGMRVLVCTLPVFALSTLLACLLDEMWQFTGGTLLLLLVAALQIRFKFIAEFSPFRGMSLLSYPIAAPVPWGTLAVSLILSMILFFASIKVVREKEY
ncbi:MAG TPA: hypothetical protein VME23_03880 [Terracidiphilus sp.]|nr:hypothetical protein [Terracidiphilus sp.]